MWAPAEMAIAATEKDLWAGGWKKGASALHWKKSPLASPHCILRKSLDWGKGQEKPRWLGTHPCSCELLLPPSAERPARSQTHRPGWGAADPSGGLTSERSEAGHRPRVRRPGNQLHLAASQGSVSSSVKWGQTRSWGERASLTRHRGCATKGRGGGLCCEELGCLRGDHEGQCPHLSLHTHPPCLGTTGSGEG